VADLVSLPLDGGGSIMVRVDPGNHALQGGPVQAGRVDDGVRDVVTVASRSLREALEPVTAMSRQILDQLAQARPGTIEVEFGIELTAEAGAILAKASSGCHLTVTLTWGPAEDAGDRDGA